ncbi:MAG: family 78 glycoside hydrolase catalytic domain, partial [Nonomuraea sp.]|nr:family 78 glycoside hydrolase catalytic domain [Nonomuraea sp.]
MLAPHGLRCDHRTTPLGIPGAAPLLSWRLSGDEDPVAYAVEVWSPGGPLWSATPGPAAVNVLYGGPPLRPRTRYGWRVTVTGSGTAAAESWFETALGAWQASWIAPGPGPIPYLDPPTEGEHALPHHGLSPAPVIRRDFTAAAVTSARLYVSAKGLYTAAINGSRVGDAELAPGWTDYRRRIQYQTHDVTALLAEGANALEFTLADGWWSGYVGFEPRRPGYHYGLRPELIAELHLDHADGTSSTVLTDGTWAWGEGPVRSADLLKGETHDYRARRTAGGAVVVTSADTSLLVPQPDEPVRVMDTRRPVAITRVDGGHLVDFGQNLAGRVALDVPALEPGTRVTIRHGEKLEDGSRLHTANLRTADATDVVVSGGEPVRFEPRFTYHGFRYAEISGLGAEPDVTALALHSGNPVTTGFRCSDPELEQLAANIAWGQRGNFVSVPTDCPQRDERLGWTADAQVFLPTACLNADVAAFFRKWLDDVRDAQSAEGGFSNVAPLLAGVPDEGAPGWADAGVIVPWHLYRVYGDPRFLHLESMTAWVDFVHRHNPDLIWRHRTGPHYNDWLAPGPETPRELLATAYFHRSADLTARAALALERYGEADRYRRLATDIRSAFIKTFAHSRGRLSGDTQTGYLLALAFGLLPPVLAQRAAARLAELVEDEGPQVGFLGVALLCPVLSQTGRPDLAHRVLYRPEAPSWLYQVRNGATTVWERWTG